MSFDTSRFNFDPTNDYLGVIMQQGRVQLDSDWNEWQAEFARRIQAGTLDTVGRAVVPATTPNAFKITASSSAGGISLAIGAGRMYVDGLLVENHALLPAAFTVVAAAGLAAPGTYGIQITPQANSTFNLAVYQMTGAAVNPVPNGSLSNQTLASVQAAISGNATLSSLIQIQDVANSGQPAGLPSNALYMLASNGPVFQVTIPAVSARQWDTALAEMSGAPQPPGAAPLTIDYTQQPYLPGAAIPETETSFLAYLDVWRRPVTFLEDPQLVEKAVGVDTTGRLQTIWQVKLMPLPADGTPIDCATDIPAWDALLQPPTCWLTTGVTQTAASGPCCLTPNTGYTGMENQLYRVEIHQPGTLLSASSFPISYPFPPGTATFKWSRDNGSVATSVLGIAPTTNPATQLPASVLTVQSLGRDQVLGFSKGDWIEISDDYLELNPPVNQPCGELHQIAGIDAASKTITLADAVTAASFPLLAGGLTDPARHTRITRWDQSGKVYLSDGATLYFDVDGSAGDIPIPPAGTILVLENGVTVSFGSNAANGSLNSGDFWNFTARTADGSVEVLTQAYPLGIHHHYARLAMVSLSSPPNAITDCRILWPPTGSTCGCTVTLQPSDLTNITLQNIVDQYQGQATNVVICLKPGNYFLTAPLRLNPAHNGITIEACQDGTAILQAQAGQANQFSDGLVVLDGVTEVTLSGLQFALPLVPFSPTTFAGLAVTSLDPDVASLLANLIVSIGVRPVSCQEVTIKDCLFQYLQPTNSQNSFQVGIFASGQNTGLEVTGNQFEGAGASFAGFLVAPSVLFGQTVTSPPSAPVFKNAGLNTTLLEQTSGAAISRVAAENLAVKKPAVKKPAAIAKAPASTAESVLAGDIKPVVSSASLNLGAVGAASTSANLKSVAVNPAEFKSLLPYQDILINGTSNANLAAEGGSVFASLLDKACIKENSFSGLTIPVLIVAQSESLQLTRNEVDACTAGFWLLSPLQAGLILYDPQNLALLGLSVALGYPLPSSQAGNTSPPSSAVSISAAPQPIRIYPGAPKEDGEGNQWSSDANFVSGGAISPSYQVPITGLTNANDAFLYQIERYGTLFTYTFRNLPVGYYTVTLKFAEVYYTGAPGGPVGIRAFNVSINGTPYLINFDIAADGGPLTVDDKVFYNVAPAGGQIAIVFQGSPVGTQVGTPPAPSTDGNAKISAVQIMPQWTGQLPGASPYTVALPNNTSYVNFFTQLTQLAQQAFAGLSIVPMRLRLADNELQGLSSVAVLILGDDQVQNGKASSLMLIGNRLDTAISFTSADNGVLQRELEQLVTTDQSKETVANENLIYNYWSKASYLYFFSSINICLVTRCVVSGNMVLNEAPLDGGSRGSFLLNDFALPRPVVTNPAPEITVEGNVFQGNFLSYPTPALFNSITL